MIYERALHTFATVFLFWLGLHYRGDMKRRLHVVYEKKRYIISYTGRFSFLNGDQGLGRGVFSWARSDGQDVSSVLLFCLCLPVK